MLLISFQVNVFYVRKVIIRNGITKICLDITQNCDMKCYIYFQIVSHIIPFIFFFSIFCLTENEQSSFLFLSSFLHSVGRYCSLICICWNIIHLCCCSVAKSCLTLCDPMDCSISGFPVLHCLLEFAQTHVH